MFLTRTLIPRSIKMPEETRDPFATTQQPDPNDPRNIKQAAQTTAAPKKEGDPTTTTQDPRSPEKARGAVGVRGTEGDNANFDPTGARTPRTNADPNDLHGGEKEQEAGGEPSPRPE